MKIYAKVEKGLVTKRRKGLKEPKDSKTALKQAEKSETLDK